MVMTEDRLAHRRGSCKNFIVSENAKNGANKDLGKNSI
jgi:hypothetical protein